MIAEIVTVVSSVALVGSTWGWISASRTVGKLTAAAEAARQRDEAAAAERIRLNGELAVERTARVTAEAKAEEAERENTAIARASADKDRRLSELYGILEEVDAPGGADRVRGLMRAHGRAVPDRRGSGPGR